MSNSPKSIVGKFVAFIKKPIQQLKAQPVLKVVGDNKDNINAVYFLNLDREKQRWESFKKEANTFKVSNDKRLDSFCHRIPGIDGKKLDINKVSFEHLSKTFSLSDHYKIDPDPNLLPIINNGDLDVELSIEEIAVSLSHMSIWQKIVDERIDYALILEDDIGFDKDFAKYLNKLWTEFPDNKYNFDILYLSYEEVERGAKKIKYSKHLDKPVIGIWWLSGYVLSYEGAKKILDKRPVVGPVDLWLNHMFKDLDVYMSKKSLITQRKDYPSNNTWSVGKVYNQIFNQ